MSGDRTTLVVLYSRSSTSDVHYCTAQGDYVFSGLTVDSFYNNKQSQLRTRQRGHLKSHISPPSLSRGKTELVKLRCEHISSFSKSFLEVRQIWNLIGWECLFLLSDWLRVSPSERHPTLLARKTFFPAVKFNIWECRAHFTILINYKTFWDSPRISRKRRGEYFFHIYRKVCWNKQDSEKEDISH